MMSIEVKLNMEFFYRSRIINPNHETWWLLKNFSGIIEGQTILELIYCGSVHGWKYDDFHRECDNKGPTITIIKCKSGKICGGYNPTSWSTN